MTQNDYFVAFMHKHRKWNIVHKESPVQIRTGVFEY